MSEAPVFIARRALWALLLNVLLGAALSVFTLVNVVQQFRADGALAVSALFAVLALFFLGQAIAQVRHRVPVVEIGPSGLNLPGAGEVTVPWRRIAQIRQAHGLPGLGGGRLDFTVDTETFARLKLGQRFLGDVVVKRRGIPNTFSVITPQLEENATAIFAAAKRYWPPD